MKLIAKKLERARDAMRLIHGERWNELVDEYRPLICKLMDVMGTANPIAAVLAVAKKLDEDNASPLFLLAVAAEIAGEGSKNENR